MPTVVSTTINRGIFVAGIPYMVSASMMRPVAVIGIERRLE
jgi:hypothetical protein